MRPKKIFYGWWIVISSALINFYAGGTFFFGFSAFFTPIRETFGWTYAGTSLAFFFQRLEGGIIGPVVGVLVDRLGPRKLMLIGLSVAGVGFIQLSRTDSLLTFYAGFLVIALGFSFGAFQVTVTAAANWFVRRRSRALSLMLMGFGMSGILVPLMVSIIDQYGWRASLVMIGVGTWVVCLPLSLLIRHKPSQYGYLPDGDAHVASSPADFEDDPPPGKKVLMRRAQPLEEEYTLREAMRTRTFWLIALAFIIQQFPVSAILVHMVPYLESIGISRVTAGFTVTGISMSSLIGQLSFGFFGDFYNKRYLLGVAFALQAVGSIIFAQIDSAWMIIPFLLIYGPGFGAPIPLRPALQGELFGRSNFGVILGAMNTVTMVSSLVSPVFAGWVYDVTGSYRPAFQLMALLTIPSIPIILKAAPSKGPRRSSS